MQLLFFINMNYSG